MNQTPDASLDGSSSAADFIEVSGFLYFTALGTGTGRELWKTDGTDDGTMLVKDIVEGGGSSNPRSLVAMGDILYFLANDGVAGEELWRTDGTANGTFLVKDIFPGESSSQISSMIAFNGMLLFNAVDPIRQRYALWRSDGTSDGTEVLKNADGGSLGLPKYMTPLNGFVYFGAIDNQNRKGLFRTDGTSAGTTLVKHMESGLQSDNPSLMINANGTLYFASGDYTELWKSDGTEAGTVMVKEFYSSYAIRSLTQVNELVYLEANNELWKSDGTEAGTVLVMGSQSGIIRRYYPRNMTTFGNKLFFTVSLSNISTGQVSGYELWSSDQTETTLIKSFSGSYNSPYMEFKSINGLLYFQGTDSHTDIELWRSDGTSEGTSLFKNLNTNGSSSPGGFTLYKGMIYFSANNGKNGRELWRTDGTEVGTLLVKDINERTNGGDPYDLVTIGTTTFFAASDGEDHVLWKTNATEAGTVKVMDETATQIPIDPEYLCKVGSTLFFVASTSAHGKELWKSDGTSTGTVMVKDIGIGIVSSNPTRLIVVNDIIYFVASDATGAELWKSDGTEAGTVQVKDILSGAASSNPNYLTNLKGVLYFSARGEHGIELWKSDGTADGTIMVKDIFDGNIGSEPQNLTAIGDYIYFSANDGTHAFELWRSDGTEQGTQLIKDINPANYSSNPQHFTALGDLVFFSADTEQEGIELWKSDGTEAGTVMVKDIVEGVDDSKPYALIQLGDHIFFASKDRYSAYHLWKSNGTEEGTILVKDFSAEATYPRIDNFQVFKEVLYFTVKNSDNDGQLWRTIGTECSTIMLTPPQAGFIGYSLAVKVNSSLLLNFESFTHGHELYAYDLGNESPTCDQTLTFQPIPAIKTFGDGTFTLEANSSSGLPVSFSSSDTEVATIENNVVTIVGAGTVSITASQPGNNIFKAASVIEQVLTVDKASQSITFPLIDSKKFGDEPFTPQVQASSGFPVMLGSSDPTIVSVVDNTLTIHKAGEVTITAEQTGSRNYLPATSVSQQLTINKGMQTITFLALPEKVFGDASFSISASTTSELPIAFESSDNTIASITTENIVTIHKAGLVTITAIQNGNENYLPAEQAEQPLTINKKTQTITFEALNERILGEAPFALIATSDAGLPITYKSSDESVATIADNIVTLRGAGSTIITAEQAGNENTEAEESEQTLVVGLVTEAEYDLVKNIVIYPNPATDRITIVSKTRIISDMITIHDATGRTMSAMLQKLTPGLAEVSIASLPSGVYTLRINLQGKTQTLRFVKQ